MRSLLTATLILALAGGAIAQEKTADTSITAKMSILTGATLPYPYKRLTAGPTYDNLTKNLAVLAKGNKLTCSKFELLLTLPPQGAKGTPASQFVAASKTSGWKYEELAAAKNNTFFDFKKGKLQILGVHFTEQEFFIVAMCLTK